MPDPHPLTDAEQAAVLRLTSVTTLTFPHGVPVDRIGALLRAVAEELRAAPDDAAGSRTAARVRAVAAPAPRPPLHPPLLPRDPA